MKRVFEKLKKVTRTTYICIPEELHSRKYKIGNRLGTMAYTVSGFYKYIYPQQIGAENV